MPSWQFIELPWGIGLYSNFQCPRGIHPPLFRAIHPDFDVSEVQRGNWGPNTRLLCSFGGVLMWDIHSLESHIMCGLKNLVEVNVSTLSRMTQAGTCSEAWSLFALHWHVAQARWREPKDLLNGRGNNTIFIYK
jgi:hypothetical protein